MTRPNPNPNDFEVISFDCYGTLVDWESSMISFLQPLIQRHEVHVIDEFLLDFFANCEPAVQENGGSYRDVLIKVLRHLGIRLGFVPSADEEERFVSCIAEAPPYSDTVSALQRLANNFRLAALSNTDADLFERTAKCLKVAFDYQILAGDVGAYKPDIRMFEAFRTTIPDNQRILHVAQSRFHDIAPASSLGWPSVWIDRSGGNVEAVRASEATATWTYHSLHEFTVAILGQQ